MAAVNAMALVAMAAVAWPATAQLPQTRIAGQVVSALTGERVVGAQILVIGSANRAANTDDDGTFLLNVLNDTTPRLVVRRIGFRPETLQVRLPLPESAPLLVRLTRAIQMVRPVVVNAVLSRADTRLEEIRERQRTGGNGHYAYRADFMKYNPPAFTDVLRRIPGIALFRTSRGAFDVRLRGNRCPPLYWLDGTPLMGIPFDPDALQPSTVEAIEVYSSASLVPPRFQGPPQAQGCGAIVIWTRHGERPVRAPKIDADSIVRLLDAQRLFVATEVEVPARVKAMQEPDFPDSLKMAGVSGSAVIEFIIEANGTLNKESIGIVSATHVRFADAVRLAILDATFEPARKADRPVAQVFQLPVTFTAPRGPERQ